MLLYGWKIVCFVISLSGLLSSWIALPVYPRFISGSSWVPVVFGIANTVLQSMFCIGLVWQMDPFQMPQAFCIAQSTLTQASWSCIAGLTAAMCCATAASSSNIALTRGLVQIATTLPSRVFLILIFPTLVFALNLGFSLRFDAIQPQDSLNCDATQPFWIRLLGYAGTSLSLSVPSFILSCITALRLMKRATLQPQVSTPPQLQAVYNHNTLTSLPARRRQRTSEYGSSPPTIPLPSGGQPSPILPPLSLRIPKALLPEKPAPTLSALKHGRHNVSSDNIPSRLSRPSSRSQSVLSQFTARSRSRGSTIQFQDRSRRGSYQGPPSPILFNSPSRAESHYHPVLFNVSSSPQDADTDDIDKEKEDASLQISPYGVALNDLDDDAVSGPLRWAKDSDRDSTSKPAYDYSMAEDDEPGLYAFPPSPRIRRSSSDLPPWMQSEPPDPNPRLGRFVAFQLLCSSLQILAAVSTLVDLASRRSTPSRVGTQHVALLLITWVPALLLGMIAARRFLSRA
ncbi:hypothetical protein BC835DRAFT_1350515 [Cytidiella melzeri]|nr:hypothetical protein BC835DRAFT_1350515 [Cytidiella melzeri]